MNLKNSQKIWIKTSFNVFEIVFSAKKILNIREILKYQNHQIFPIVSPLISLNLFFFLFYQNKSKNACRQEKKKFKIPEII